MKTRRLLLIAVFTVVCSPLFAQTYIGRQLVDQYQVTAWNSQTYGLTWLPNDYAANPTKKYPLIIFLHGAGETGTNQGDLWRLISTALPQRIASGWDPEAVNPVDGQNYKFIVISPQAPSWSYSWGHIRYMLWDVQNRYRVDTNRVYITGLSAGGAGTLSCYLSGFEAAQKYAAIVPICPAGTNNPAEAANLPYVGGTYGGRVWTICGANDSWMSFSNSLTQTINTATPAPLIPAVVTSIPGAGHDPSAWNTAYNPAWRSNALGLNVYEWMLKYSRPLQPNVANAPPVVNAGADQTITLPVNQANLTGSATDIDNNIATYLWSKVSGPAGETFTAANAAATTVNNLVAGTYVFRLTVTDSTALSSTDEVQITVNNPPNVPPVVNAGADITINLPMDSVLLTGTASDPDGSISSYAWAKASGPASYNILSPATAQTKVRSLTAGLYRFVLSVTDNSGAVSRDTVAVQVNGLPNQAPTANAGADASATLPVNTVTLNGSGIDPEGAPLIFHWRKIAGPAAGSITDSTSAQTTVSGLAQGLYTYRLRVRDSANADAFDTVQVRIYPALNIAPSANAGADQTIQLPLDSVLLNGSGIDTDGAIVSYRWRKIAGSTVYNFSDSTNVQTWVRNLNAGTYGFELTVTDDSTATAKDTVLILVRAANAAPVVNAGGDQTIQLPQDSTMLNGSATDADGTIARYQWIKVAGPTSYRLQNANSANTAIDSLTQGVYQFALKAVDNDSASVQDTVQITVLSALNNAPFVSAGNDTTIQLPVDSVRLNGTAIDADGSVVSVSWAQVSGPAPGSLRTPAQSQTWADSLRQGIYQFVFTATDDSGAVSTDTIRVTVRSLNVKPVVNAGPDKNITLPVNSTTVAGTATDSDGSVASYRWRKISGPVQYRITQPDSAQTVIDSLVQGFYEFELKATDTQGAFAMDTMRLNVSPAAVTQCGGTRKVLFPGPDGGRYYIGNPAAAGWYYPINPGDTIVLSSQQQWSYFSLDGYKGTPSCPIVIMNDSAGVTKLTAGIELKNCQYFKITGSGHSSSFYGFYVHNPLVDVNGVAIGIQGKSKNVEVERVSVYKKTYGVWAKQDPLCDTSFNYPNYVMDSINIHHSTFKNIGQDCIYAGNTDPLGLRNYSCNGLTYNYIPMRLSNIEIHHLIIDSCNRTGIMLSGADRGVNSIHDNVISNCGYEYDQNQGTGISIGGMTRNCRVYNNKIKNTFIYGILSFGVGTNYIENNEVDSSGYLDGVRNGWSPSNIMVSPKATIPFDSTRIIIRNNKLGKSAIEPSNHNILLVTWGPPTWATNNIVCGNTALDGVTPAVYNVASGIHYIDSCNAPVPNIAPTAFAGPNKRVVLPADSVLLQGSGVDPDGYIVSYKWTQVSGTAAQIVSDSATSTMIRGLAAGTYTFRLTVTDNQGATGQSLVQVYVGPPNVGPLVNAGPDQTITLPVNSVTLTSTATDTDGTIAAYGWTFVSGPANYTIASPGAAQTTVNNLVVGTYTFMLRAADNEGAIGSDLITITVLPGAVNVPPIANAGSDINITLPASSVNLSGSGIDPDGTIAGYQWTKVGGPASYNIVNSTSAQTAVNSLQQGVYLFELTVTDNQGATGKDTIAVTVFAAGNLPPVVNAGMDQTITLPANSVTLNGTATDADGSIASVQWTKVFGPGSFTIVSAGNLQTNVLNLTQGVYSFVLTATDNTGASGYDTVVITVAAPANTAPVVNAGGDQTITLPTNSVLLNGTATDSDGAVMNVQWTKISGPATFNISAASQLQANVTSLVQGVYAFELSATDNAGAVGKDTVIITVLPAPNTPPVANAGPDQTLTLPVNSTSLNGTASDADGSIATVLWTKIGGPAQFSISSTSQLQTTVSNLVQGVYLFRLTVMDNAGASVSDTVAVTVLPANIPPVVNAGPDVTIMLPQNSAALNGTATDTDGFIGSSLWTKISGPASFSIANTAQLQTTVTGLVQGVYQFELAAADNNGVMVRDTMTLTVNAPPPPPNVPPVANAGSDITVQLPANFAVLQGSGTDADGVITAYQWVKISGPAGGTVATPSSAATTVVNLQQGMYRFELTVTDNSGATGKDTVQVTVLAAANIPPVANAGSDITISLPQDTTSLNGSGTDADGTVVAYQWRKISGPVNYTLVSPTAANSKLRGLTAGVYQFELSVTDNSGATDVDTVTVTVNPDTRRLPTTELYPNPATSTTTLTINAKTDKNWTVLNIYDAKGRVVYHEEFMRSNPTMVKPLDVSMLKAGLYFIEYNPELNTRRTIKMVKL
jgi:hypothetical protein